MPLHKTRDCCFSGQKEFFNHDLIDTSKQINPKHFHKEINMFRNVILSASKYHNYKISSFFIIFCFVIIK